MGLFDSIFNKNKDIKFNNQTLRAAVKKWLENPKKATSKYRHISSWDTSMVTDMSKLFLDAHTFNENINNWDVSNVTNMHAMFDNAYVFNQPLDNWDVSKVTNMGEMFSTTKSLAFNQPIGNWDVSNVTNMEAMFDHATFFNQPIGNWDVSNVTNIRNMFANAKNFNQPIGDWDVSSVTKMNMMFYNATVFNQPIGNWDVSNVTDMSHMFSNTENFNQPIGNWDVSSVTDMSYMFNNTNTFNKPIGNWDVSNVNNMSWMFADAKNFNQPIGNWVVSSVTDMSYMFDNTNAFNKPIGNWDVSNVTDMSYMFSKTNAFNKPIGNWDVSNVTEMFMMFDGANFNGSIGDWDVSNVTCMSCMFSEANAFNKPIGNWDVSNVTDMSHMFSGATSFNQDIGNWDVGNVTDMSEMFKNAESFNQPIGSWDVSNDTKMFEMFEGATSFKQDLDTSNIPESPVKLEDLDLDAETKQKVEDQTLFVKTDGTIDDTRGSGKYIIETMNFFANNFNGINIEEIIFDLQTQSTINYETAPYNDIDGNWHLKMGNTLMRCFSLTNFETVFGELLRLNNISEGSQMCRDDYDSFEDLTEIYKGDGFNIEVHPPINHPFRLVVLICNDDDDDGIELNIDQTSESNHKTLAFVISMFKLVAANGPEIEEDILNFMSDVADEYELQNFNHFFQQMFLPEYAPNLLKNDEKYIKSLSEKEFEELLFILIKLSLLDKKLTNSELKQIEDICSSSNHSRKIFEETINLLLATQVNQKSDGDDFIIFRSCLDTFHDALEKFDNGEDNDALSLINLLLAQLRKDKLYFGKIIENKAYLEGTEVIPLANIYFNRGQCHNNLGEKKEALKDFVMATLIDPEQGNPLIFHHAGCTMFELEEHTKCIEYFDKAIELDEIGSSESYYMRAGAYLSDKCEKQNVKKGLKDLKKYLELNPEDVKAKKLLEQVEKAIG